MRHLIGKKVTSIVRRANPSKIHVAQARAQRMGRLRWSPPGLPVEAPLDPWRSHDAPVRNHPLARLAATQFRLRATAVQAVWNFLDVHMNCRNS